MQKNHQWEWAYGKSNGPVIDDVMCLGLFIRNWLHTDTPLPAVTIASRSVASRGKNRRKYRM